VEVPAEVVEVDMDLEEVAADLEVDVVLAPELTVEMGFLHTKKKKF